MKTNISEYEFLSLIINYPELFERIYVKEEYFENKDKIMFSILKEEYNNSKTFILENLCKYKNFDIDYYIELLTNNFYKSNKDIAFIELQKNIISNYKQRKMQEIFKDSTKEYEEVFNEIIKLNEINYNEIEYITAKDIYSTLTQNNKRVEIGYPKLDVNLNISEHDLVILAGGTGGGKTAFALNMLNKMSRKYQCIYFNMEMSKNILYKRLIGINTGYLLKDLNNIDNLDNDKKENIKFAMQDLERRKIILLNKSFSITDIRKQIANIKNDKHTIIFLDHIGLIKSKGNSLYEKMTNIAKELRSISLDYNCTIIGLCQLSRESQKNNDMPKLQDLRDSGEIEQSSRKTILLYNKTNDTKERFHEIDIIIAKNDDGNKTIHSFEFDRYTQNFEEKYN